MRDKGKARATTSNQNNGNELSDEDDPSDEVSASFSSQINPLMDPKVRYSTKSSSIVPKALAPKNNPKFQVRGSDPTVRTLDSMFAPIQRRTPPQEAGMRESKRRRTGEVIEVDMLSADEDDEDGVDWIGTGNDSTRGGSSAESRRVVVASRPIRDSPTSLTSIRTMRADVEKARHQGAFPSPPAGKQIIDGRSSRHLAGRSPVRDCQKPQVCRRGRLRPIPLAAAGRHAAFCHRSCGTRVSQSRSRVAFRRLSG